MVRVEALKAIGGLPTESVTEDFLLTVRLSTQGWKTVYLNEALTEGLAPEGLQEYMVQRGRWCLGMMEIVPRLEKRTHYLSSLANIGMLVGLLGTIIALIHAFGAVSQANPAEKASLLAAAISEAMNNTAAGLFVAITLLLTHMFLESKTTALIDSLEIAVVKFLNSITERYAEPTGPAPNAGMAPRQPAPRPA